MGFNPYWPMATVIDGDFEWNSVKAEANLVKHDVSFPEAATVFADPLAIYFDDGSSEGRMVVIGTSLRERCSSSSTSNAGNEIGSSALGGRRPGSGKSTRPEVKHESGNETASRA
jgi:uncharacterized DUF497 family protein